HRKLVETDVKLPRGMNIFERRWLRQILFCATARESLAAERPLAETAAALAVSTDPTAFERVPHALLVVQSTVDDSQPNDGSDASSVSSSGTQNAPSARLERLKNGLRQRLRDPQVRDRLRVTAAEAFGPAGAGRARFLRRTLEDTLAD